MRVRVRHLAIPGGAAGPVSGGLRGESGLDFERAGGGMRTALGQSLRWCGIQARRAAIVLARLREPWFLELACA